MAAEDFSTKTDMGKIELLNGRNYQSWKYNMKLILMERGLWSFAEGLEEEPAPAKEKRNFRCRSDKAYSLIALAVEKPLQIHISSTMDNSKKSIQFCISDTNSTFKS